MILKSLLNYLRDADQDVDPILMMLKQLTWSYISVAEGWARV